MFGIGTEELLLILVIALVVLGPERMPKLARDLGRMVGEFRKTSDDLRNEFLNADRVIDVAARTASTPPTAAASEAAATPPADAAAAAPLDRGVPLDAGPPLEPGAAEPATEAEIATAPAAGDADALPLAAAEAETDETLFDREAREARERLHDPARARQATAEGWKTPTDQAGTTDRWG